MPNKRIERLARFGAATALLFCALPFVVSTRAYADPSASIGVTVDQPTTTTAPPATTTTTPATTTTTAPATTTTTPATTTTTTPATTTTTIAVTVPVTVPDTLPEVLPPPVSVSEAPATGFVSQVKSAARTTKDLVKGVVSGKPVADVVIAVLPENVATVVVPAVRAASTFVFPIGLAGAVIAFLVLQQRIDSGDPKLSAAPLAHDDDVVEFS